MNLLCQGAKRLTLLADHRTPYAAGLRSTRFGISLANANANSAIDFVMPHFTTLTAPPKSSWRWQEEREIEGDAEAALEISRYLALADVALRTTAIDSKTGAGDRPKVQHSTPAGQAGVSAAMPGIPLYHSRRNSWRAKRRFARRLLLFLPSSSRSGGFLDESDGPNLYRK